jgi:integrase
MPRLVVRQPKYCKHGAYATCYVNGREVSLGAYDSAESKQRYNAIVSEWCRTNGRPDLAALAVSTFDVAPQSATVATAPAEPTTPAPIPKSLSITDLVAAYRKHAEQYYRKNGRITSEVHGIRLAVRFLRKLYARDAAESFGPKKLTRVRDAMVKAKLARTTINQCVNRIRRMFRWAAAQELIPGTVVAALDALDGLKADRCEAVEPAPVEAVPDSVVNATAAHLPIVVRHMVELQRLTGMRPQEVCLLRPCDIDRSGDVWTYTPHEHKNQHHKKQRTVFIGPKAQRILKRYLLRASDAYCFSPAESEAKRLAEVHEQRKTQANVGNGPGKNRKRWPRRKPGSRYTTASYRRCIKRTIDAINEEKGESGDKLIHWSPNQLRHACASEIRAKFGLDEARTVLGHSTTDMTEHYAKVDGKKAAEVARQLG